MPAKSKKQVSESKALVKAVEAEAQVVKKLAASASKSVAQQPKKKGSKKKKRAKSSKMTPSAMPAETFRMQTKHQHPKEALAAFNALIAPDKAILDGIMVGESRYPDGFNATSTAQASAQFTVNVPANSTRLVIPVFCGPLYDPTGTSVSAFPTVALVSTYDPLSGGDPGIKPIDSTTYTQIPPNFGSLLASQIIGQWTAGGRVEGTGRSYKVRSGVARARYEPNAYTQVKIEGFQTVTGTEGAFPSSGEPAVTISSFRKSCKKNQFRFGTPEEPGACIRFLGSTEYGLFRSPFPANRLFDGVPDIAMAVRKLVLGERLTPAMLTAIGFSAVPDSIPPIESLDYVPVMLLYNDSVNPIDFLVECGHTLEFLPEQTDGLPCQIADPDPYWNELAAANMNLPWFTGPHSFWSSLWDGVKSVASYGWNNIVKPIFAPAANQAVNAAAQAASQAVGAGAAMANNAIAARMAP